LEKLDKIQKNRNSNLVIFGLSESKASTQAEKEKDDIGGKTSQLDRNEILKAARQLKSSIKFKNVFISPDLSVCQRKRLNELKVIRNERSHPSWIFR